MKRSLVRLVAASAGRTIAVLVLVLAAYFLLPIGGFRQGANLGPWLRLAAVVLVFSAAMAFAVWRILAAGTPRLRAVEFVIELVVLFICLFALLYLSLAATDPDAFSEPLGRLDALYFTASTFATVGFGDITPVNETARVAVTVQMLLDLGVLALIAKTTFFAAGRPRRQTLR
ncbi:ion channel [Arthrobacter sp. USHLN218]|uniref:ion channel n=1 Tax=Arthrobacter sp. USHLN218 TaxID=3081232 RepID=UPI00301635E8